MEKIAVFFGIIQTLFYVIIFKTPYNQKKPEFESC